MERVTIVLIEESRLKDFVTALVEMTPGGQSLDISSRVARPSSLCCVMLYAPDDLLVLNALY